MLCRLLTESKERSVFMGKYYLGVDIGASSGRHILAHLENGRMYLEEMHRFPNGMKEKDGEMCWDVKQLFAEILTGMRKCREAGKIPESVGIDTWGVDFVLLDAQGQMLGNAVGYRDGRTTGMDEKVYEIISEEALYGRTGIQKAIYNTIYQLQAVKHTHPEYLAQAADLLFLPDYFHYLLSGVKANEYTESSTSGLLSPVTKDWDLELIRMLGYPEHIFRPVSRPGTVLGYLTEEIRKQVGFDCKVVLPASHDTGSAVLAVPSEQPDTVYISSGTWSLMGVERKEADCSAASRAHNFTNEGGYDFRFRYLKNIMGLWMIQSVKKEWEEARKVSLSFGEICEMASRETIASLVDCNDDCFLAPDSMIEAVQDTCRRSGQEVPRTIGEIASVVYNSLAKCYGTTIEEIEQMTGRSYGAIHVVGGGSNAEYLNRLTALYTGRTVYAGPSEATAIGNVAVQMLSDGEIKDLTSVRKCIFDSFAVKTYEKEGV